MIVPTTWHTLDSAIGEWIDAPQDWGNTLETLLDAARVQCEAFAPALVDGADVPVNYRLAQLMQARALWQSTKANPQGELGEGGFAVQVFPMDWTVRALLRPRRGVPVVG